MGRKGAVLSRGEFSSCGSSRSGLEMLDGVGAVEGCADVDEVLTLLEDGIASDDGR